MRFAFALRKYEHEWLPQWLEPLSREGWFDTVLYRVRSGKEAAVYCCEAKPSTGLDLIAAKVYLPPGSRAVKYYENYTHGHESIPDEDINPQPIQGRWRKMQRSDQQRRKEIAWVRHEYQIHQTLYNAGAKTPQPLALNDNAILTSYVGDRRLPAQTLLRVKVKPLDAGKLFMQLLDQIALFLSQDLIHGDLSPHNVLMWHGDFTIIDLPQAVNAQTHPEAFSLLHRDIDRLCKHFQRFKLEADPKPFAETMWTQYIQGDLHAPKT